MKKSIIFNVNNIKRENGLGSLMRLNEEIKIILDFFTKKDWDVYLVDWISVNTETLKPEYVIDFSNTKEVEVDSLNDLSEFLVVRYVGSIESRFELFSEYLNALKNFQGRVVNNLDAMLFGMTKEYLFLLQENNFPVIESYYFHKNIQYRDLSEKISGKMEDFILKPISGECGNSIAFCNNITDEYLFYKSSKVRGWVLQPVVNGIKDGEYSLIFIDGDLSHAIKKIPQEGNIQINERWQPVYEVYNPNSEEIKLAKRIQSFWPHYSPVMRFDFIRDNGELKIMEVETVNPFWYLHKLNIEKQEDVLSRFYKLILKGAKWEKKYNLEQILVLEKKAVKLF